MKETAFWLAQFTQGRLRGRRKKQTNRGTKIELGAFLLFVSFGSAQPHMPQGCTFLSPCKYNWAMTRSCNTGPPFQIFATARPKRGNYTLLQHIWCCDSILTWLKQPRLSPHKVEAKHSRIPTHWELMRWKLNAKKKACNGSDKKPSVLESGTVKTNSA